MMHRLLSFFNNNRRYVYFFVAFCVLCVVLLPYGLRMYNKRVTYNWEKKYHGNMESKDPFGAYYLKQYLQDSWHGKLYFEEDSLPGAFHKHRKQSCNYLIVSHNAYVHTAYNDGVEKVFNMAYEGNRLLFGVWEESVSDALGMTCYTENFFEIGDFTSFENYTNKVTLYVCNARKGQDSVSYVNIWNNMLAVSFTDEVQKVKDENSYSYYYHDKEVGSLAVLLKDQHDKVRAYRRDLGRGCITMGASDYFFTNYGIQYSDSRWAMEHLMSATFDESLPLVVVYNSDNNKLNDGENSSYTKSMYYVLLEHKSSAMFIMLLAAALLLVIVFNTRRRQRPKDELQRTRNSSIVYIKHLATLYDKKSDYNELLRIEHRVLLYQLRKEYFFDIRTRDFTRISQFASLVANSHKLNEEDVRQVLQRLESLVADSIVVSREDYLACIKSLDGIFRNSTSYITKSYIVHH